MVLLMFVFWLAWRPEYSRTPVLGLAASVALFVGVLALLVLGTRLWSRALARRVTNLGRSLDRFNRLMLAARIFIPLWFITGMALLGWWQAVANLLQIS